MPSGRLSLEQLRVAVADREIDTVVLAFTDMQGRLQGKRFHARHFLEVVVEHGAEGCDYLLAVDVEMNTVAGYAMSSWDTGYGDLAMVADFDTLCRIPWHPGTAMVLADLHRPDGTAVAVAPRQILQAQLRRLADLGYVAYAGTELEFVAYRGSYEDAARAGYRDLVPANLYNGDYSLLATARIEPLLRRIRLAMAAAGLAPESAKGECNLGQHEIAFRYAAALRTADQHSIYKNGVKEIAAQEGMAITFMAKPNEREGNSCHVHFSLRTLDGDRPVAAGDGPGGTSGVMAHAMAGLLATLPDLTMLYAPNVNSYKRYREGSFAPTAVRWGVDNRTCALRLVGQGAGMRVENRVPGADVNPYLALAAMVAGAVHGIQQELPLEEAFAGNAYLDRGAARVPATLRDALERWQAAEVAAVAFGQEVVDHYANAARVELAAFDATVTDWELRRGFERL